MREFRVLKEQNHNPSIMSDVNINIYGGTQQIAPNATTQNQYFCGDQFAEQMLAQSAAAPSADTPEQAEARQRLALYINNVEELQGYITMLSNCQKAREVGEVVATMRQNVDRIDDLLIAKEDFISLLLPFIPRVESGRTVGNLRKAIDNAWQARKDAIKAQQRAQAMHNART